VGGITGIMSAGSDSIKKSYALGTIEGIASTESNAGGIAGRSLNGSIENCYAWADVSISTGSVFFGTPSTTEESAGGIVGTKDNGTISKCYAAGTVKVNGQYSTFVGGIAGNTGGSVSASMALVEELDGGSSTHLRNVYAISATSGTFAGSGNYSRNDMVYKHAANSNFDYGPNARGGRQTPLADFKTQALYTGAGWSFPGDWKLISGYDYPVLSWQTAAPGAALEEADRGGGGIEIEWP
jgi:hypothetical protein